MGVYQYDDLQTGRGYDLNIVGDVPTDQEFARLANKIQQDRSTFLEDYETQYGVELNVDDGTAVSRGLDRGVQQIKQAFGETLGTAGEQSGLGFLANYGQGLEERSRQELGELLLEQPERMQSTDVDGFGSALTYAGEVVGEQIPQLGLGLGAAVAAPVIAGAAGVAAPFVVGAGAAALVTAPILFGNNIQRQEDEVASGKKARVDISDALTATFGQAILEGVSDKILLGSVLKPIGKSIFTRTVSRAGGGATTESLTEVGQQMMERAQAGLEVDSDDAIAEYREAAIAGGLIGGGTRATIGSFGERGDTVPVETDITDETDTTQAIENAVETAVGDQANAALETEARNAADPAAPEGKAEQKNEQQAADSAKVATDAATPSAALVKEEANLKGEATRAEAKAVKKAEDKTQEYLPGLEPVAQEDRTAALESEETGQKIEVKNLETVEAAQDTFTPDFVSKVFGVPGKNSPLSKAAKSSKLSNKPISDPAVLKRITGYVNNKGVQADTVKATMAERGYAWDGKQFVKSEPTGLGGGVAGGGSGVAASGESGTRDDNTAPIAASIKEPVGGGVPLVKSPKLATGVQPDTLVDPVAEDFSGPAIWANADFDQPITVLDQPAQISPDGALFKKVLDDEGTESFVPLAQLRAVDVPQTKVTPEEVAELKKQAEVATAKPVDVPQADLQAVPQAVPQADLQAAPDDGRNAAPGRVTGGGPGNLAPPMGPAPVQAPVQGAVVPQEQLQAMETQRDTAAQAELNRRFEFNRQDTVKIREYHDTQVDPRDVAEVTTAVDKEGIVELLNTTDKELNSQAKAAKLFFKRFRRPVDALDEMGMISAQGETKSIKKDYTSEQFVFYKGMTQKSAMDARKWVFNNMSPQAMAVTRDAAVLAKRDTPKANLSDKYIGMTKAIKEILRKDNNYEQRQQGKALAAYVEAERIKAISEQINERLALDSSMTEPANILTTKSGAEMMRVTRPIKGRTAFESYLIGTGLQLRENKNKVATVGPTTRIVYDPETKTVVLGEEIMDLYEGYVSSRDMGFLLIDPMHGLDQALLPSIRNALQRGDLQFALNAIAATSQVDRIREIAAKLGEVAGTTQVQVVDDLSQMTGRKAAGMFEPETNTIYIDATNGMNVHTVLHEMTHAATSAAIANPSLPEVKQLQTLLDAVREQFGEVYGTRNLDEFVAEAFSNPEFQSALALTKVDGGKMSGWEKFTGAIKRVVRKILGLSPSPSALTEVDRLIDGMLSPSPSTRAAPSMLLMAGTKKGASQLLSKAANLAPEKVKDYADVIFNEGASAKAKSLVLNTLPVNILTDIASGKIPFAEKLNLLIKQQSGALRQKSDVLNSILDNLHKWQRKNKGMSAILNNIIPRSTYLKIDPSRGNDAKYMKTIRDDKERSAEYDELFAEYNKLDAQGKAFYGQMRNYFQDTYDDILSALEARLDATIPDAETRKTAFEQLRKILEKDTGKIRPYFPLLRKGKYRLSYQAIDPSKGNVERFVEYYPTLRKAEQAKAAVLEYNKPQGKDFDSGFELTEATSPMSFDKVPSSGFIRDILQSVQFNQERFNTDEDYKKVMQELVDLSLDAMPERSFMQSLRRRKGVRGFLGDTTPTGMGGMDFDSYTMLKEKGRDLNRQLVQLKSAAELEKFRKDLAPYKTDPSTAMLAEKLEQIAKFAQSPNVPRYSQVVNSLGFGFTMGLNFSSAAITFFDVAMSAMPVIAGKHKIGPTARAFRAATKLFAGSPSKRTIMVKDADGQLIPQEINMGAAGKSISNYDLSSLPEMLRNVRADILIAMGIDQGQFNQSMTQENLEIGRDAPLETFNKYSSFMFHHSERFNRETTLTASYVLEVQKMQREKGSPLTDADYREAAQEAINTTEFTLGSTAAAGRPIVAQGAIGNILFLFKRFAISKYYMMAKLAQESAKGDPVARAAGRNFLISTGLFAGLGGMPLMGGIGAMYNMFADDDEDDFEAMTRKFVGEGIYGGLSNEILGVDLANRISLNSLLYRSPIIDKDQSNLWTLIEQLGGPVIGVGLSVERGVKDIYDGEVQRGIESMAPASIRNGLKALRFATEGATTRRGDPIIEDINPYNVVMQGLGFAPQAYIQQLEANKNARRREDTVNSRKTKLLRRRNMAIREGDGDEFQKVELLIEEYNAGLPQDADTRKKQITGDTKRNSLRAFGKTTSNMRGGVTTTEMSQSILDQYDF